MKLWNDHVVDNPIIADRHVKIILDDFIDRHAAEVNRKNLYKNFVLHVNNLHDFGLLSVLETYDVIVRMQEVIEELDDGVETSEADDSEPVMIEPEVKGRSQPTPFLSPKDAQKAAACEDLVNRLMDDEEEENLCLHLSDSDDDGDLPANDDDVDVCGINDARESHLPSTPKKVHDDSSRYFC